MQEIGMRILLGIVVLTVLSGCASFGNPEYGCKGLPEGTKCMATRDIYEATGGGQSIKATKTLKKENNPRDPEGDQGEINGQAEVMSPQAITDPVIDNFVTPNLPDRPVPVRTPAKVMRIWVASWEDVSSGALISPGYIYTEIEPRRWVIGKPESAARAQRKVFKPLEASSKQP
jgi:conjugal transfer pilus assembly protein TraV